MAHYAQQQFCERVKTLFPSYFDGKEVLDIGSLDINGCNRYLFPNCHYVGLDIASGPNVDIISLGHEYTAPDLSIDTIVSTECFEHDMYFDKTLHNIVRMLKPQGLFFFTCASSGRGEHGTVNSKPYDSPLTSLVPTWCNYYKNVTETNIRTILDIDNIFEKYLFEVEGTDIRFYGIKK